MDTWGFEAGEEQSLVYKYVGLMHWLMKKTDRNYASVSLRGLGEVRGFKATVVRENHPD